MKISVIEPLGVPEEKLKEMLCAAVGDSELVFWQDRRTDTAALIERCRDADAVVLTNIRFTREVMEQCPLLKYICVAFTGYDHVDMEYCREKGILVSNCAGYSTAAVSELVFGLIGAVYRKIMLCDNAARNGKTSAGLCGIELEGKKFGVIGAGAIGARTAAIARAFGCEVYAYSRTKKDIPGVTFIGLDELMSSCDIVSVHVPSNSETAGLVSRDRIAMMKRSAILINTARGPVVDNNALAEALNSGSIAGAGIDVFNMEPPLPSDYPLTSAKNCVLTPHVGFLTNEAMVKRAAIVAANLKAFREGRPINTV